MVSILLLFVTPLYWWLQAGLVVTVLGMLGFSLYRWQSTYPQRICTIEIASNTNWRLVDVAGKETVAELTKWRVYRRAIELQFVIPANRHPMRLRLLDDAVNAEVHRRLRAGLNCLKPSQKISQRDNG